MKVLLLFSRFYGPMVFYLVWNKLCDNYIAYQLSKLDFDDAHEVIRLYGFIHPTSKTGSEVSGSSSSESSDSSSDDESSETSFESKLELVRLYIKNDSLQETKLNIALESMLEQKAAQVSKFFFALISFLDASYLITKFQSMDQGRERSP